ncbi:hypothetical protein [Alteraurantiacibacter aestuarii]|uniref:Uncharacterized protein n=1 Tax=Alteraurantiacibacter aestuarii TaxID=650004 RepID=A0A844ZMJ0_9SPHN|nr:hypothetical protein [Alteraurantiacibacter aestuarii]MXO88754.1 hypothetical protein [Alteraurantiacibacter aestuarii]
MSGIGVFLAWCRQTLFNIRAKRGFPPLLPDFGSQDRADLHNGQQHFAIRNSEIAFCENGLCQDARRAVRN